MRKFKCSKEVSAERIVDAAFTHVTLVGGDKVEIPERVHGMIHLDTRVNEPGYLVVYKDGYMSYSPKAIFEEGYQPITDKKVTK